MKLLGLMKKLIDSSIIFAFLVVFGLFAFSNTVFADAGGGVSGCREPQCSPEAGGEGVENVSTNPDKEEGTGGIVTTAGEELAPISSSITNQSCDALNPCPGGLECFSFPDTGLRCAQPDPCSYYTCPEGTQCAVAESYPGQVMCSCVGLECTATSSAEDMVSYDISKQTVVHIIKPDEQTVAHSISLLKATPGNKGILETTTASAKYSNELVVENSRLFMETSTGKKLINVLPEDAISISEIPNIEEIELEEDSQKPMYYVRGTKQAKILSIIPVSMKVETKIDAETGNKMSVNKPWWSFLAW